MKNKTNNLDETANSGNMMLPAVFFREGNIILDDISLCDNKINEFIKKNPLFENQLSNCFLKLKRTAFLTDILYPSHIDELLNRVINNEPLEHLTDAEVLATMSKVNQFISLPGNEFATAIKLLFQKLIDNDDGIINEICNGLEERSGTKWNDEANGFISKFKSKYLINFRK